MERDKETGTTSNQGLSASPKTQKAKPCKPRKNDRFCNRDNLPMHVWPQINVTGRKIGYARVSTKDQKLRMQLEGLNQIGCDKIFKDPGVSGSKGQRPGLNRALKYLRPGDSFIVFKLDRLGRSVLHLADLLTRFHRQGIHFCSMSEGINTTTPSGKMVYHILAAVAEFQRDIIIENTLAGLEAAKSNGKILGRPPKLSIEDIVSAHECIMQRGEDIQTVATRYGVSRDTIIRGFDKLVELSHHNMIKYDES